MLIMIMNTLMIIFDILNFFHMIQLLQQNRHIFLHYQCSNMCVCVCVCFNNDNNTEILLKNEYH
jgi:hypothetical protein